MPSDKRRIGLTITDDRVMEVLGYDPAEAGAHHVWGVLTRHADLIERATVDVARKLKREDWCLIADALNGCMNLWDQTLTPHSAMLIRAEIEDAQSLNGLGDKWYGEGKGVAGTARLSKLLGELPAIEVEAVCAAVRRFWLDPKADATKSWWGIPRRKRD